MQYLIAIVILFYILKWLGWVVWLALGIGAGLGILCAIGKAMEDSKLTPEEREEKRQDREYERARRREDYELRSQREAELEYQRQALAMRQEQIASAHNKNQLAGTALKFAGTLLAGYYGHHHKH